MWILAIAFMSLIGCAAYFVVEILPTLGTNRHVRTARAQVVSMVDPERRLRAAQQALDIADTAANRIELADALSELGRHAEALPYYREALGKVARDDPRTRYKLARALFETGDSQGALTELDALPDTVSITEGDQRSMLRARALEHLGRRTDAALIYDDIVTRISGEEARCRYAALLIEMGDRARARALLEEVESRMKRMDRTQRAAEADMYSWASKQLATLRAG